MRKSLLPLTAVAFFALLSPVPQAHAVSKDMIQLQTQVQQLQDMLQHLQQSNDERMGVLQHLVEQSSESVTKMSQQMTALQGQLDASTKNETLSGQIQSLNDSVDELKTRIAHVDKQLQDMQSQMQNVQAQPAGGGSQMPSSGGATPGGAGASGPSDQGGMPAQGGMSGGSPAPGPQSQYAPAPSAGAPQAPPVDQLYQSAIRDYNGARYEIAISEFADVMKYYPSDALAGNAAYYLGEISYRQGLYPAAIKNYDTVLEQFAGSSKAPAAQLRKAQAELATSQKDAGIRDLRSLVQRYPTSPEGAQARSLLNGMGIRLTASKPSPGR